VTIASASGKIPVLGGGHWLWGHLEARRKDPLTLFTRLSALGDVAQGRILWMHGYMASGPDAVKHVLVDNAHNYIKGRPSLFLKPLLGEGLFTAEGNLWKRNRRLAQPAFHRERIERLVSLMVQTTSELLGRWEMRLQRSAGEAFDILPDMMSLTMSVVARALFTADVSQDAVDVRHALTYAIEETNRRILTFNPWVMRIPSKENREFDRQMAVLDRVILKIIDERRRSGEKREDLLALLMDARDAETGEGMSDRQLRDEVMTLFLAGHETTAVALSWTWYLLAKHPEVEHRVRAEVEVALAGRAPTAADIHRLELTRRVFEETLRLYPPVWIDGREALGPDVICGFPLPAQAMVLFCPYAMHRNPRYWESPETFDPDRFLPERSAARPKHAYIPFGAGQRMCIGNVFATVEAQVITAMVVQRLRLSVPAGASVEPDPLVTLRPKGGMILRMERVGSDTAPVAAASA
jgi:cytochrome P450